VYADKSQSNIAEAPFDSVLLRWGENSFAFAVSIRGQNGGDGDKLRGPTELVHCLRRSG
jgi:hypothetical protein